MALNHYLSFCILLVVCCAATTATAARNEELLFSYIPDSTNDSPPADNADKTDICFNMVSNAMMDCFDYLSGDTMQEPKPSGSCCSGTEYVFKTDEDCICLALKAIGGYGIQLNMTKVSGLSTVCKIAAPPLYKLCDLFKSPVVAPAQAPKIPIRAPVHSPISAPAPIESPNESPIESPVESPIQSPVKSPIQSPVESPVESPKKSPPSPSTPGGHAPSNHPVKPRTPPAPAPPSDNNNNNGEAPSSTTTAPSPSAPSPSSKKNSAGAATSATFMTTFLYSLAPLAVLLLM